MFECQRHLPEQCNLPEQCRTRSPGDVVGAVAAGAATVGARHSAAEQGRQCGEQQAAAEGTRHPINSQTGQMFMQGAWV